MGLSGPFILGERLLVFFVCGFASCDLLVGFASFCCRFCKAFCQGFICFHQPMRVEVDQVHNMTPSSSQFEAS